MKAVFGWPASWALYYFGHWSYLACDRLPLMGSGEDFNHVGKALFRMYQTFMRWSWEVNDWAGLDVWSKPQ